MLNTIVLLLSMIGCIAGIFFGIKYFIRYHAEQKNKKTKQQEEIERMNIQDL